MHYFSNLSKNLRNLGNFEKIFENFQRISYEIFEKCILLAYFSEDLTNPALIFHAFGQKTQIVKF